MLSQEDIKEHFKLTKIRIVFKLIKNNISLSPPSGHFAKKILTHLKNGFKLNNRMLQMVSRVGNIQDHKQEQLRMQKEHLTQAKKQMENNDLQYMHPDQVQKYQGKKSACSTKSAHSLIVTIKEECVLPLVI